MTLKKEIALTLAFSIALSAISQKESFAFSFTKETSESLAHKTCALVAPVLSARHRLLVIEPTVGALLSDFHQPLRNSPMRPSASTSDTSIDSYIKEMVQEAFPPDSIVTYPRRYIPGPIGDHEFREEFMSMLRQRVSEDDAYLSGTGELIERVFHDSRVHNLPLRAVEEIAFGLMISREADLPRFATIKMEANLASLKVLGWLDGVSGTGPGALHAALVGNSVGSTPLWNAAAQGEKGLEDLALSLITANPPMDRDDEKRLLSEFSGAPKKVLYFADNAMEITFDLAFVRYLVQRGHEVVLVGKESDANVDMTAKDLRAFLAKDEIKTFLGSENGLHLVQVISSGSRSQGTDLRRATSALIHAWSDADVVIAKGEGNARTLNTPGGLTKAFYSILIAKSAVESGHMKPGHGAIHYFPATKPLPAISSTIADPSPVSVPPLPVVAPPSSDPSSSLPPLPPTSVSTLLRHSVEQESFGERLIMGAINVAFVGVIFFVGAFILLRGMVLLAWDKLTDRNTLTDTDKSGMVLRGKMRRSA